MMHETPSPPYHSVDSLKSFIEQYLAGELEVYIKSEPLPEDNDKPLKVW